MEEKKNKTGVTAIGEREKEKHKKKENKRKKTASIRDWCNKQNTNALAELIDGTRGQIN